MRIRSGYQLTPFASLTLKRCFQYAQMLDGPLMEDRIGFLDGKHHPLYVDNMRQWNVGDSVRMFVRQLQSAWPK